MDSTHSPISFREVVETHKRALYYLSLDLTGNHHDAEDLSQEVFIKAHKGLATYRGDAQMYTWLRRIAINTYLNKKRKKSFTMMSLLSEKDSIPEPISPATGPEEEASFGVTLSLVEKAMNKLAPRERLAFVLKHHQEMTIPEVSKEMDVADGTVKSLLFRATKKLQASLAHLNDNVVSQEVSR